MHRHGDQSRAEFPFRPLPIRISSLGTRDVTLPPSFFSLSLSLSLIYVRVHLSSLYIYIRDLYINYFLSDLS